MTNLRSAFAHPPPLLLLLLPGLQPPGSAPGADGPRAGARPQGAAPAGPLAHLHPAGGLAVRDRAPEAGAVAAAVRGAAAPHPGAPFAAPQAADAVQVSSGGGVGFRAVWGGRKGVEWKWSFLVEFEYIAL